MSEGRVGGNCRALKYEDREGLYLACCQAMADAASGLAGEVALEVGSKPRVIQRWFEVGRMGECRHPLYDLLGLMRVALRYKQMRRALRPLYFLADQLEHDPPTPRVRVLTTPASITGQVAEVLQQSTEAAQALLELAGQERTIAPELSAAIDAEIEAAIAELNKARRLNRALAGYSPQEVARCS